MSNKILIIDDDMDMCRLLERFFIRHNFEVVITNSGKKGLEEIQRHPPDVVLCEFRLSDTDGKALLVKIKNISPQVPVIIITGYSEIKVAVEVMKHGAFDYVTKPLLPEELLLTINRALEQAKQTVEQRTEDEITEPVPVPNVKKRSSDGKYIFGDSKEFVEILEQIELVAPTNYSVIISGESGSGKEAIAQEIHAKSKRKNAPFIAIDCGVLSNELAASELFGHEKGSFTGAASQKTGSLELANEGTVFLDEISNLSYDIQTSLLRVVQERKLRRVGGIKDIDLDIRIVVASNERLADAAKKGWFREDLYYRFNEFSIHVPPLRQRKNDILTFAHFFLNQSNEELDKHLKGFTPEVEHIFKNYSWPGNLRELKNVVKRSAVLAIGDLVEVTSLPFELVNYYRLDFDTIISHESPSYPNNQSPGQTSSNGSSQQNEANNNEAEEEQPKPAKHTLKTVSIDAEYEMIVDALKKANFNKSKAAKLLNVDRKTLYNKMKLHSEYYAH